MIFHSIQLHEEDERASKGQVVYISQHLPVCVYVQKPSAEWTVGDCKENGVYPIKVNHAKWFLDSRRPHPKLGILRYQLPLAPGFAVTVHSVQGKEIERLLSMSVSMIGMRSKLATWH